MHREGQLTAIGGGPNNTRAWTREAVSAGAPRRCFPHAQVAQPSSPARTSRRQLLHRLQSSIWPERAQSPFERGASRSCFFVFACGSVGGGPGTASYAIPGSRVETIPSRRRAVGYAGPVLDQALSNDALGDVVLKLGLRSRIWGIDLVASVGPARHQHGYPAQGRVCARGTWKQADTSAALASPCLRTALAQRASKACAKARHGSAVSFSSVSLCAHLLLE